MNTPFSLNKKPYSKHIKIFKGAAFISLNKKRQQEMSSTSIISQKVIAFDLDETLGYFSDLYILWYSISKHIYQNDFYDDYSVFKYMLDFYPEFLRYGILNILGYLYHKKISGECSHIYLYTNNQCFGKDNPKWISLITRYFEEKVNTQPNIPLFDHMICAFKINNQIIEPMRTTQTKTYNDFIRCTLLPKTTEICFIDNTQYNKMKNDRVYYIQPKSYQHSLYVYEIIDRFASKWIQTPLTNEFMNILQSNLLANQSTKEISMENSQINLIVSQKIMYYLKEFFLLSTKTKVHKTKKISLGIGHFTRKNRNLSVG
jgi:hypothetical protein